MTDDYFTLAAGESLLINVTRLPTITRSGFAGQRAAKALDLCISAWNAPRACIAFFA